MRIFGALLGRVGAWTVALLALLLTLSLTGDPDGVGTPVSRVPLWSGVALSLACYPAGVALSNRVLGGGLRVAPLAWAGAALACVAVLVLVLGGWLGPLAVASGTPDLAESYTLTLPELRAELRGAVGRARSAAPEAAPTLWKRANALAWDHDRRLSGAALALLFGTVGLLVGHWAGAVAHRELRRLQMWAMGLFLLASMYLAGENGYELIAVNADGPALFTGLLVLIVPSLLVIGIGWPTLLTLLGSRGAVRHAEESG